MHSFLIIGQSNMAGRGFLSEAEPLDTCDGRLFVLRNGRWQTMYRPVNPDRDFSGTCLAESFAKRYAEAHPDVKVGIIPCADGGTSLDQWHEGELLFDHAVFMAKLAMRTSRLAGILWHQGEGDCADARYPYYLEKITAIMNALRRQLNAPSIPIVVGGLGDFLKDRTVSPALANYPRINEALLALSETMPHTAFASAEGLTSNPDNLHFNHQSLQEFGIRYYDAYQTVSDGACTYSAEAASDDTRRTEMELL